MGILGDAFNRIFARKPIELDDNLRKQIDAFAPHLDELSSHFVTCSEKDALRNRWAPAYEELRRLRISKRDPLYQYVTSFRNSYDSIDEIISESNAAYIRSEKLKCKDLLSDIDGKSLDEQQRTVVVTDDDRNLVAAGAGCGKTLTIAGKVKYLCDVKGVAPEDILLIAFTRKSAEELSERIARKLALPVQATTFHKLGLDVITQATGSRPDVLDSLTDFVRDYFEKRIVRNQAEVKRLIEYFAYYLKVPADLSRFDSLGEAYDYEKGSDFETLRSKYEQAQYVAEVDRNRRSARRTLRDEQVKSLDEVQIANFLFLHGVNYEYERLYPFKGEDAQRKAYRPDFYLPDYDIYLEHFGIDRNEKLPWLSPIEEAKYIEDMRWKRDFHRANGTVLLETYSYLSSEGTLLTTLESMLLAHGVTFHEPDFANIFEVLYEKASDRYLKEFISLCCTFIILFKSGGHHEDDLPSLTRRGPLLQSRFHKERTALFLQIVEPILMSYNSYLREQNAIDFADMINDAARRVEEGHQVHPYKWVIVDEYQDISIARYRLVHAILEQTGAKLLCVGDDWQSIYRFAGSDISLFTRFEQFFGRASFMRIEQTYRNSQELIDVAGEFITKNPAQLKKRLRSPKNINYPITFLCYGNNAAGMLRKAMDKIIQDFGTASSILLLGRTNNDREIALETGLFSVSGEDSLTYLTSPDTPVSFLTVHRAKGLEADNVVLLNFENSTLGFPNKISDDPILELVLTEGDSFPYAEERRLLYVALTRTRNRVFVLVKKERPSEFFREFSESKSVFVLNPDVQADADSPVLCPRCKTGRLVLRTNENNRHGFVGCSNYPQCDFAVNDTSILQNPRYCPQCGGFLIKRRGKWGPFYGCTNYPVCSFTEKSEQ